jgi:Flp pilus assembly protein TadB
MFRRPPKADAVLRERGAAMKDNAAALWHFVRNDRLGRAIGIAWAVVAWFALTWLSLGVTVLLLALSATLVVAERKRRDVVVEDDLDDLL